MYLSPDMQSNEVQRKVLSTEAPNQCMDLVPYHCLSFLLSIMCECVCVCVVFFAFNILKQDCLIYVYRMLVLLLNCCSKSGVDPTFLCVLVCLRMYLYISVILVFSSLYTFHWGALAIAALFLSLFLPHTGARAHSSYFMLLAATFFPCLAELRLKPMLSSAPNPRRFANDKNIYSGV